MQAIKNNFKKSLARFFSNYFLVEAFEVSLKKKVR
jgi:hypothetical protein